MSFRPEAYQDKNLIRVKNVPLREDMQEVSSLSDAEKTRILKEGTISLNTWNSHDVQQFMMQEQSSAVFKSKAVGEVFMAAGSLQELFLPNLAFLKILPPGPQAADQTDWHSFGDVLGNVPAWVSTLKAKGGTPPAATAGYEGQTALIEKIGDTLLRMRDSWRSQDAAAVNKEVASLATLLPQVNPGVYPSMFKRQVEVVYDRMAKMTIPGAICYFAAFVLFLMAARSSSQRLRVWALRLFVLGFIIHTAGIGIRWWLVGSIPIKNEFESVMFSAWFGCAAGLILELFKPRAIFGAGASFVGWLSLIALFGAPFVAGRDLGGQINQVNGVLMSYWLYIHVTLVTASYALITMGFLLSAWWLVRYYRSHGTLSRVPGRLLSADAIGAYEPRSIDDMAGGAASVSLNWAQTLARLFFIPAGSIGSAATVRPAETALALEENKGFLARLDQCNLVVLQLAFWTLGVGIICGAIWADESWGRPWGWDPKETFALVTWIVYLIVVHVRVTTKDKAWWTAVLSIFGFIVMLINWIGVNYFLVGLHSYA
jgi:cytochrome c-type biogenesis protein CcsB